MKLIGPALGGLVLAFGAAISSAQPAANSGSSFKTVDNPGGGQFIYGPLTGRGTQSEAMVYMLRQVHEHFGDRPEVGKFFQSRDGSEVATFFAVNATKQGGKPMQGLLIIAMAADGSASTAVLFDEKGRFGKTEPTMIKSLFEVWHPAGATAAKPAETPAAAHHSGGGAVPQLTPTSGGDHSAAISVPAGWKIDSVNSGALVTEGPKGERIFMAIVMQGVPVGPDLFTAFVNANNQGRIRAGFRAATYSNVTQTTIAGQARAIQALFTVDLNDGLGPRKGSVRVDAWGPNAFSVSGSNIPVGIAEEEGPTMLAIIHSYTQNEQMMANMRKGEIDRVRADAARANAQSAAIDARREANTASYNQKMSNLDAQFAASDAHMDNIDRASKMNQNYILDQSVVTDNENGDRGTVSNAYADSLVRANPNRYQLVPNQELVKGKDY
jgi:hypothetical protein